jgi:hypothetical protein
LINPGFPDSLLPTVKEYSRIRKELLNPLEEQIADRKAELERAKAAELWDKA